MHKKSVTACVRRRADDGLVVVKTRVFVTVTGGLLALADWLAAEGVSRVAMESTGVYWKPVYYILEERFEILLVNAQHIKRVPGRKTDVQDAEWIAQLLQHGLLSPSFVPPPPIRVLRDLTRQRTQLTRQRSSVVNRIQKVLEDANIKLGSVASDTLGVSGRAMIQAMIAGQDDPEVLAELARARLRAKMPELREALLGRINDHHRFLLKSLMDQLDQLEGLVARYDQRIEEAIAPFAESVRRLRTIPGVGAIAAEVIIAEIGVDMSQFPDADHLASWAGMCPGNHESAGKRKHGRTTKGSRWLRALLTQVGQVASRLKGTVFESAFHRWVKRMGKKKAVVAVGRKILIVAYKLQKEGVDYEERTPSPAPAAA